MILLMIDLKKIKEPFYKILGSWHHGRKLEVFLNRHLLDLQDFDRGTWENLIQDCFNFSNPKYLIQPIEDKDSQVAFLFLEPSTRTQTSFGIAAQKLNLKINSLYSNQSSLIKGETLMDTALTLEAMGIRSTVIRLKEENQLLDIKNNLNQMSLISAGEGKKSHPTQALLDACTIFEHFQRLDNLKILFLGDVEHSRVYASNLTWLKMYNNTIYTLSPNNHILQNIVNGSILEGAWDQYLDHFDIIYMLRPQLERHHEGNISNLSTYHQDLGISPERFKKVNPNSILMHPGPFYRNIEFSEELLREKRFKIYRQVYWGVLARMSVFNYVLGKNHV